MDVFAARVPFSVSRYQQARDWCANHISTGWKFGGFVSAALMEFLFRCEADAALFKKHWAEILDAYDPTEYDLLTNGLSHEIAVQAGQPSAPAKRRTSASARSSVALE